MTRCVQTHGRRTDRVAGNTVAAMACPSPRPSPTMVSRRHWPTPRSSSAPWVGNTRLRNLYNQRAQWRDELVPRQQPPAGQGYLHDARHRARNPHGSQQRGARVRLSTTATPAPSYGRCASPWPATWLRSTSAISHVWSKQGRTACRCATIFRPQRPNACSTVFDAVPEMLAFYTDRFGPYPFDAYGGVVVPFGLGYAMENQTMNLFGLDSSVELVIAHELMHEWFGNNVSLSDWQDIWLNEGFAYYIPFLWAESAPRCESGCNDGEFLPAGGVITAQSAQPPSTPMKCLVRRSISAAH